MSIGTAFSAVDHFFKNFFVTVQKTEKVFEVMQKDLPSTAPVLKQFWQASLSLAAATTTTISDKGIVITADMAEFEAVKQWLLLFKQVAVKIEGDFEDAKAVVNEPAAPPIPIPSSVPATQVK